MAETLAVKRRRWPYAILGGVVLVGLAAVVWLAFFSRPLAPVEREMVGTWLVSSGTRADFVIELRGDRTFERTEADDPSRLVRHGLWERSADKLVLAYDRPLQTPWSQVISFVMNRTNPTRGREETFEMLLDPQGLLWGRSRAAPYGDLLWERYEGEP